MQDSVICMDHPSLMILGTGTLYGRDGWFGPRKWGVKVLKMLEVFIVKGDWFQGRFLTNVDSRIVMILLKIYCLVNLF